MSETVREFPGYRSLRIGSNATGSLAKSPNRRADLRVQRFAAMALTGLTRAARRAGI
jgi:hypothetical protein